MTLNDQNTLKFSVYHTIKQLNTPQLIYKKHGFEILSICMGIQFSSIDFP